MEEVGRQERAKSRGRETTSLLVVFHFSRLPERPGCSDGQCLFFAKMASVSYLRQRLSTCDKSETASFSSLAHRRKGTMSPHGPGLSSHSHRQPQINYFQVSSSCHECVGVVIVDLVLSLMPHWWRMHALLHWLLA